MNLSLTIATGKPFWGNMALNWCLSVKANNDEQPTALICSASAIAGIEDAIHHFFDYVHVIEHQDRSDSAAYHIKTQLYDICFGPLAAAIKEKSNQQLASALYMDADTLMLPGRNISDWFTTFGKVSAKSKGTQPVKFTAYCNDAYNYTTGKRNRNDYTFWCDPNDVDKHYKRGKNAIMPQINSSFLYFTKSAEASLIFDQAKKVWADDKFPYQPYKGVKPDELCFNIACATLHGSLGRRAFLPHQVPFRPTFFQCFSESWTIEHILQNYPSFGFAGTEQNPEYLIDFYNNLTTHYRRIMGYGDEFKMSKFERVTHDENPIVLEPVKKQTIVRAGDLPNSDAGAFNPGAIDSHLEQFSFLVIRKEAGLNKNGKYIGTSAIPHFATAGRQCELKLEGFQDNVRVEDFRLFKQDFDKTLFCNHSLVTDLTTSNLQCQQALSIIDGNTLRFHSIPALPVQTRKVEKNWVFFFNNGKLFCLYSISPYLLFWTDKSSNYMEWKEFNPTAESKKVEFFHKGQFLCNSTNPIYIPCGDKAYFLSLFHTKEGGIYYQGAVLINPDTMAIEHSTYNSIVIKHPSKGEGLQKGLIYVSSITYHIPNTINIYFGEGDSHSAVHTYNAAEFIKAIIQNSNKTNPTMQQQALSLPELIQLLEPHPGGQWSSSEKKEYLYDLVCRTYKIFGERINTVELGVFGGSSLFCLALAHKHIGAGSATGIDTWDNIAPLEGTNSEANNQWWATVDIQQVKGMFEQFYVKYNFQDYCRWIQGKSYEQAHRFPDDSITILHQDGNHNQETITKELNAWSPKMKIDGYWVVDDTNWTETAAGYAKLPLYGFELVQQFDTWAVYQKRRNVNPGKPDTKDELVAKGTSETAKALEETVNTNISAEDVKEFMQEMSVEGCPKQVTEEQSPSYGTARKYSIQPLLLHLPDTDKWIARKNNCLNYLSENGFEIQGKDGSILLPDKPTATPTLFKPVIPIAGVHAERWGITGTHIYMRDMYTRMRNYLAEPGTILPPIAPDFVNEQFKLSDGKIGGYISHYILYSVMSVLPDSHFMVMEDDCRFVDGWEGKLWQALQDVPEDFDFLFVGSACAMDKDPVHVKGDVYHFPYQPDRPDFYPQTGHCYIVAKKCMQHLISTNRDTADPVDISLIYNSFPTLNVYAILPRLADQGSKTELPQ